MKCADRDRILKHRIHIVHRLKMIDKIKKKKELKFQERVAKGNIRDDKDTRLGRVSMILCMIAAIYIATIPESIFSIFAWITYIFGAMTGIIHLNRIKEVSTKRMYIIWLILDIFAATRLLIIFFA